MTFKKRVISILLSLLVIFQIGLCCVPTTLAASTRDLIYDFLKAEIGYNTAVACGILANIEKESNFNPTLYGDHGSSYGICQWHATRFTALKDYCNENGYNWKNLNGQLQYLKYELTVKNKKFHAKMKAYPNTADGAYNAAYLWCYDFEIPANRAQKAVERGNTAANKYWPLYSGEVKKPTITLTYPAEIKTLIEKGEPIKLRGTVYASGAKTVVKGYIKDENGKVLQSAGDTLSSTLDLKYSNINNNLQFGKLESGTYTLYIIAENSKGSVSVSKTIMVKGPTNPKVKSVKINDAKINYSKRNSSVTIKPTVTADVGAKYTTTWASSDKSVATVDSKGKVTALKSGKTTITCTVKDTYGTVVKDTCVVNVTLNWWEWVVILIIQAVTQYALN